ncbi:hypothetical protein [Patulibacter minatonensis]|uniref:hypothetical protein n=1 Tax=Patulibacter minatonensis TaxID=298163 RepID=UPI00047B2C83|nr:hypothetical protein [Patulibacter minatonensis]
MSSAASATPARDSATGPPLPPTVPLLLLGGAGLPAWAWDRFRDALPAERPTFVALRPRTGDRSLGVGPRTFPAVRGYVRTAQDPDFPLALQDRHAATLGADRTETVATGHLPMLEDPVGTAAAVERLLA